MKSLLHRCLHASNDACFRCAPSVQGDVSPFRLLAGRKEPGLQDKCTSFSFISHIRSRSLFNCFSVISAAPALQKDGRRTSLKAPYQLKGHASNGSPSLLGIKDGGCPRGDLERPRVFISQQAVLKLWSPKGNFRVRHAAQTTEQQHAGAD